jgi:hypothetical protein
MLLMAMPQQAKKAGKKYSFDRLFYECKRTVLIDLLDRGVTESQIIQLINFAGEWNKYWQSSTTNGNGNLQQPVNGGNNPGSSGGNGYGGNLSVNDLIRLNLLKSTTTNLLKSARSPPGL